jgi:hypothetical protein
MLSVAFVMVAGLGLLAAMLGSPDMLNSNLNVELPSVARGNGWDLPPIESGGGALVDAERRDAMYDETRCGL